MILVIEVSLPFQKKPGYYMSGVMFRVWWLWFAIAISAKRIDELIQYEWEEK